MEPKVTRKVLVGGNWKCKLTLKEATDLVNNVYGKLEFDPSKVCKPFYFFNLN